LVRFPEIRNGAGNRSRARQHLSPAPEAPMARRRMCVDARGRLVARRTRVCPRARLVQRVAS
jgi:hypothetical protein